MLINAMKIIYMRKENMFHNEIKQKENDNKILEIKNNF